MAGFLMLLDKSSDPQAVLNSGVYATKLSPPKGTGTSASWLMHHEATVADYLSMRAGDFIFFFQERRIFGVGRLADVGSSCVYQLYPGASNPATTAPKKSESILWHPQDMSDLPSYRWLCCFLPYPRALPLPVDMDDALASHPAAFRSLRVIWKRSFIKLDDTETDALLDILSRRNDEKDLSPPRTLSTPQAHKRIAANASTAHLLSAGPILAACSKGEGQLAHEMAIEAGLVHDLNSAAPDATDVFGRWDFVTHQVHASPFKPVDYMDKIDVFGYRRLSPFNNIGSYLVAEVKKDVAGEDDIRQLLKYVDWVAQTYCSGDYSQIEAFLLAHDFTAGAQETVTSESLRWYTVWSRPVQSRKWFGLRLVRYRFDAKASRLRYAVA